MRRDLYRRIERLEATTPKRTGAMADPAFLKAVHQVYGRPGEDPPTGPVRLGELYEIIDDVYREDRP